jgi:hypothetical protein
LIKNPAQTELEAKLLPYFLIIRKKPILRAEEEVYRKAVNVLDIANRKPIKVVLAVRPK